MNEQERLMDWHRKHGLDAVPLSDTRKLLELAAASIECLEPRHWAGQVLYLIEALDAYASGSHAVDASGFLAAVHRDLGQRIEEGGW